MGSSGRLRRTRGGGVLPDLSPFALLVVEGSETVTVVPPTAAAAASAIGSEAATTAVVDNNGAVTGIAVLVNDGVADGEDACTTDVAECATLEWEEDSGLSGDIPPTTIAPIPEYAPRSARCC